MYWIRPDKCSTVSVSFDPSLGFPDLRKCIYRIARDTRFSVNKEPYKTNMGVVFSPSGTTHGDLSCYYMHVEPGGSFISCGVYMPSADVLKAVRKAIDDDWEEFEAILNDKSFKKAFGDLSREEKVLKRVPAGFAKDSPSADYLKLYHFLRTTAGQRRTIVQRTVRGRGRTGIQNHQTVERFPKPGHP